jgi:hypothetical protein
MKTNTRVKTEEDIVADAIKTCIDLIESTPVPSSDTLLSMTTEEVERLDKVEANDERFKDGYALLVDVPSKELLVKLQKLGILFIYFGERHDIPEGEELDKYIDKVCLAIERIEEMGFINLVQY